MLNGRHQTDAWLPATRPVDLRSDAVTKPDAAMWEAMQADPLDWTRDGDRTVAKLEDRVAAMLDKPAGLFLPSGTMANTLAAAVWTRPGDAFVVDDQAHVLRAEGEGYRRVARLTPHRVPGPQGHPTARQLADAFERHERVSLVWTENTHTFSGGTVAPPGTDLRMAELAARSGVRVHLDGARLWNASVASGRTMAEVSRGADSVSVNLAKGLGCPAGSVLCGPPAFVAAARQMALALGGHLAQAGLLAACGLVAMQHFEDAIRRDHALASELAAGLRDAGVEVGDPPTNIVLVSVSDAAEKIARLARRGILAFMRDPSTVRFVTHRDISPIEVDRVIAAAGILVRV